MCVLREMSVLRELIRGVEGVVFDLDGVITDTAKYHYQAWKRLANHLGFDLTEEQNEQLKGISREASLERLLAIGGIRADDRQKAEYMRLKNEWYVALLSGMTPGDLLPGVIDWITGFKSRGVGVALASASRNARIVLDRLGVADLFDAVVDGNAGVAPKPAPDLFLLAARKLGVRPQACIVFEDAAAGVQAARAAGMKVVGVGRPDVLAGADAVIAGFVCAPPFSPV